MAFPYTTIKEAWKRQGGKCAKCCKELIEYNRDVGEIGAWHAHHRKPEGDGGDDSLGNCVILCINEPENCHFNFGHGGISWAHHSIILDSEMPCLRSSDRHLWEGKSHKEYPFLRT
jgi:hypothetical protein